MTFDMQKAREICGRIKGYEDPDGGNGGDFEAAEMLPAALDEIERQANRIAELEEALVEERISGEFSDWIENQCPHWDIDVEPFCVALDGPCEYREGKCPISRDLHVIAHEQLRREGKL